MCKETSNSDLKMIKAICVWNDAKVRNLYRTAFPKIEQLPYLQLKIGSLTKTRDFFVFKQNGKTKALAFLVVSADYSLLYYLAVDEAARGTGIGSECLKLLKQYYKQPLLVIMKPMDSDAKDYSQRLRRKDFYERAGFVSADMTVTDWSGSFSVYTTAARPDPGKLYNMLKRFTPWDEQLMVTENVNEA